MDVFFNNTQRAVLPQVIEALQRLRDSPQQLAHERDRYLEPPPPYSESEAGETTQPATPGSPVEDEYYREYKRKAARARSKPLLQFRSQAKRERERLEHQISTERLGRRQTLPWDDSLDLQANSENNVRSIWVEQGIWGDEWGPAWPKDSHPMTTKWTHRGGGPFFGPHNPTTSKSMPGARWGHEDSEPELEADPGSDPGSEPEPEPEPEPQREQEEQEEQAIFGIAATRRPKKRPKSPKPRRPVRYTQTPMGPIAQYAAPRPTVRNPEASRPYNQFLYQMSKERDWLRDEHNYKTPGCNIDLDARAYEGVKSNWITDGIWNRKWGDLPGKTWAHEEPEEGESVGAVTAPNGAAGDQQAYSPRHPTLSWTTLIPESYNGRADSGSAQASGHDENYTTTTEPGPFVRPGETSNRQNPFTFGSRNMERGHQQYLGNTRNTRPYQAETGSGQRSSSPSIPAQVQIHPSVRSAVISGGGRAKQGAARSAPVHRNRRADPGAEASKSQSLDITGELPLEHSVPSPARQSKWKRNSDALEDAQPPKRPRRDTRNRNQGDDIDEQTSNYHAVEANGNLTSPGRSAPPPPRRSKRDHKPDVVEDRQSPKRARRNTRRSVTTAHDASNAADTNKETPKPKADATKGMTRKKAALASKATGRKQGNAANSIPLRRSARNANKGKETVGQK